MPTQRSNNHSTRKVIFLVAKEKFSIASEDEDTRKFKGLCNVLTDPDFVQPNMMESFPFWRGSWRQQFLHLQQLMV
jgi:hypothetical protein